MANGMEFYNVSKTAVSGGLQQRLQVLVDDLTNQMDARKIPLDDYTKYVEVLLIGSEDDMQSSDIIFKKDVRGYVKDLKKIREQPPLGTTLDKCEEETDSGVLRVLYISDESCGTLKAYRKMEFEHRAKILGSESMQEAHRRLQEASAGASEVLEERRNHKPVFDAIMAKLAGVPKAQALSALEDADALLSADLDKLRTSRRELEMSNEAYLMLLFDKLPGFKEKWEDAMRRVKNVVIPPSASTANNIEAIVMAASYVFDPVTTNTGMTKEEVSQLIGYFSRKQPLVTKLLKLMDSALRGRPYSGGLQDFGVAWMASGFPKLEIGHQLAASLAMTDVPDDIEVLPPWKAWSLVVPPGLLGDSPETTVRVWCEGAEARFFVSNKGEIIGPLDRAQILREATPSPAGRKICVALDSLVRGACLALSNPDDYKKNTQREKTSSSSKTRRETGTPDFSVSRFMLSAPVQIDVRQHLLDYIGDKKKGHGGGSPTTQFFVRGHWRNQAHGPGRSLRKTIRIEGFWKGPEEGRVLLRNYKVKDDEKEGTDVEKLRNEGPGAGSPGVP